jgi:hypothetical protein
MKRTTSLLILCFAMVACAVGSKDKGRNGNGDPGQDGDGDAGGDGDESPQGDGDGDGDGDQGGRCAGTIKADVSEGVTVSGEPRSVEFSLVDGDGNTLSGAEWATDDTRIGSISEAGTFTANGYVGGVVVVTACGGGSDRTFELVVDVDITENADGLSDNVQEDLLGGGSNDSKFRWLYPYDGTVFPRGVLAPSLQLDGAAAQATYLEITAPHYSYKQFAGASNPTRIALSEDVWRGLSLTVTPKDAATVRVTKQSGGEVTGPAESSWRFASADLTGIVYYSTYNYKSEEGESNGAIMRIRPGKQAELVESGCTVCHTVSAHGNVLATGVGYWADGVVSDDPETFNPTDSATYDLSENGGVAERYSTSEGRMFSFMALSPDGAVGLTSGIPAAKFPPFVSRGVYANAGFPSELIETATGDVVPSPTLAKLVTYAQTPAFAPDGSRVVFVNGDRLALDSADRVLSVMDADLTNATPTFSNLRNIIEKKDKAVAWPTFLPDANGVVYHDGDSHDSSLFNPDANAPAGAQYAELRLVDIKQGRENPLHALNGRDASGKFYLPYGGTEEGRMNYEASVLPVAVGGYYWVLFASRRAYGNTIAPGGTVVRGDDPWGTEAMPSPRKKIWIAAIDVNYGASSDPSHPAFYLPGQGLEAGNMRAFAALAPCKPMGESCNSGSDCCEGYCRETSRDDDGAPVLECVMPPASCSNIDEPCETADDCCDSTNLCINNRCTQPSPVL